MGHCQSQSAFPGTLWFGASRRSRTGSKPKGRSPVYSATLSLPPRTDQQNDSSDRFLDLLWERGLVAFTTIAPEGGPTRTRCFDAKSKAEAMRWLREQSQMGRNIY